MPLLRWLAFAVLLAHAHAAVNVASLSGTVEIDLIFPKNEVTYEPTVMMPIVFAVQNANLAATLDAGISVKVQTSGHGGDLHADEADLSLAPANLTNKDVYYAYMYSTKFRWEGERIGISWILNYGHGNCSRDIRWADVGDDFGGTVGSFHNSKQGGEKVGDWAAAHAADCSNTQNLGLNITGTRPLDSANSTKDQCGLLAERWPALNWGTPCKVKVDESVSASITKELEAAFTHAQCAAAVPIVNLTCPNMGGVGLYAQSRSPVFQAALFLAASVATAVAYL